MHTLATIPVTVTDEAAAHIAKLGMQAEFQQMVDHARQFIPGLQCIDVRLQPPYDTGDEDQVLLYAHRDPASHERGDRTRWEYSDWTIKTFSPDVYRHFTLLLVHGMNHAG